MANKQRYFGVNDQRLISFVGIYHKQILAPPIPDICHGLTDGVRGEKICHVENFQIPARAICGEV